MEFRPCSKKLRPEKGCDAEERQEDDVLETRKVTNTFLYGIQPIPAIEAPKPPGVIFVFEKASLVHAQVGKTLRILNADAHADFLRKKNLNPANYRPDIIHEVLVSLYHSRLNLSGRIARVYIRTDDGKLISMQPNIRMPKTVMMFGNMISQLFQTFKIRPKGQQTKQKKKQDLIKLIVNPLSKYLPTNSRIIGLSCSGKKVTSVRDYVKTVDMNQTLVFVVGAMAHGTFDSEYTHDLISVSDMPLTAAKCVWKICYELEQRDKIL